MSSAVSSAGLTFEAKPTFEAKSGLGFVLRRSHEETAPVIAKWPRGQFLSQQSGPPKMTGPDQSGPPPPSWPPPASPRWPRFKASPQGQLRPRARPPDRFRAGEPGGLVLCAGFPTARPSCLRLAVPGALHRAAQEPARVGDQPAPTGSRELLSAAAEQGPGRPPRAGGLKSGNGESVEGFGWAHSSPPGLPPLPPAPIPPRNCTLADSCACSGASWYPSGAPPSAAAPCRTIWAGRHDQRVPGRHDQRVPGPGYERCIRRAASRGANLATCGMVCQSLGLLGGAAVHACMHACMHACGRAVTAAAMTLQDRFV